MDKKNLETIKINQIARFVKNKMIIEIDYNNFEVKIVEKDTYKNKSVTVDAGFTFVEKAKKIHEDNNDISVENAMYFLLSSSCPKERNYIQALNRQIRL